MTSGLWLLMLCCTFGGMDAQLPGSTHRHFGGTLDDPEARLEHYITVLVSELREAGLLRNPKQRLEAGCCRPSPSC